MSVQYMGEKSLPRMRVYYSALQDDGTTAITDELFHGAIVCWDIINNASDESEWFTVSQCDAGHIVPAGIVVGFNTKTGAQWIDIIPFGYGNVALQGKANTATVAAGDAVGTELATFEMTDTTPETTVGVALETVAENAMFAFRPTWP